MARILYVEASSILRQTLSAVLLANQHEVVTLDEGNLAWSHLQNERPDLIILPLRLPGLDGIELMRRIRATDRLEDVPVVILTDVSDRKMIERAVALRPRKVLVKSSFSLDALLTTINSILEGKPVPRRHASVETTGEGLPPGGEGTPGDSASPVAAPVRPAGEGLVISDEGMSRTIGDGRSTVLVTTRRFDPMMTATGRSTCPEDAPIDVADVATRIQPDDALGSITRVQSAPELVALAEYVLAGPPAERWVDARLASLLEPFPDWRRHVARIAAVVHQDPIDSEPEATVDVIERLGPRLGADVVMLAAAVRTFDDGPSLERTALPPFWEHAAAVASIARRLSADDPEIDGDVLWLAGILHDVVRLAAIDRLTDLALGTLHTARRCDLSLPDIERRTYGTPLDEIGEALLRAWGLPEAIIQPAIAARRDDFDGESGGRPEASIALAERLAHAAILGDDGSSHLRPVAAMAADLGITAAAVQRAIDGLEPGLHRLNLAIASTLGVEATSPQSQSLRETSSQLPGVVFVGDQDRPDSVRCFLSIAAPVLSATAQALPGAPEPAVAVVRIATEAEVMARKTALESVETARGLDPLGVVALVDENAEPAARAAFAGRRFERIASQCSREALLGAIRTAAGLPAGVVPDVHVAA